MKYCLFLIVCWLMYSCTGVSADVKSNTVINSTISGMKIGYINGHLYYYHANGQRAAITHAGDCPKCKQDLIELIKTYK